jgi:beta-N-acetylhexosaminidase
MPVLNRTRIPLLTVVLILLSSQTFAQKISALPADYWVDSVFKTLSKEQKIGQLMVVRLSSIGPDKTITFYEKEVEEAVRKYYVGGICLFQGGPVKQANLVNYFQSITKTPILISIDAETGIGMRMDSVMPLPRHMMLGAVQNPALVYEYGRIVGEQCKRIGIQVNYAPVVDINNNPANPVINDRSFGENKYRVAEYGIAYMKGMQDAGVMACAKHFPGHGDVAVDSHYDLPLINKSREELDSLELYPFQRLIKEGVGSVMVAHLSIPAIDNTANKPTSISYNSVTKLLRKDLGFDGLTFTDALEMKGVTKYFPDGEASLQAVLAGNDMLCLPGDIPGSIEKIKKAINRKKLSWKDIDARVKRILHAKYKYGLSKWQPINTINLTKDLNSKTVEMRRLIAENAITVLRNDDPALFPLATGKRVAYIGFGLTKDNNFARRIRDDYNAQVYYFDYKLDSSKVSPMLELFKDRYDVVIIGMHNYARYPANNFGISGAAQALIQGLQQQHKTIVAAFGNPYALKDNCNSRVVIACYDDDEITQGTTADLIYGRFLAKGKLPVTVCESFKYGDGIIAKRLLPIVSADDLGFQSSKMAKDIDSIVTDAIKQKAFPGAVVLVAKDGKIAYERAFGYMTYDSVEAVYPETMYDMASVTKIMATTLGVMKLYDEGKLDLQKTIGDYLPWVRGTDKASLKLWDVLLHQAGLKAWIPFYRETIDTLSGGGIAYNIYNRMRDSMHTVRVAENVFMRRDYVDTMYKRILQSELGPTGKYIYSDNDYIFLGKIIEQISGMTLDEYVRKTFYDKLNLKYTGFKPRDRFPVSYIAPTENEALFRQQLIRGDVHDPGAAMFGGVAGHAGLFSNAYELAVLAQVLVNGGVLNGQNLFKRSTIQYFTEYHSEISRRGLGFDKPEKDNATRREAYPTLSASPLTYGHTGFTGTCFWVDPKYNLVFIFLSNRVNSPDANKFLRMSIRPKVHEAVYKALLSNYGHEAGGQ